MSDQNIKLLLLRYLIESATVLRWTIVPAPYHTPKPHTSANQKAGLARIDSARTLHYPRSWDVASPWRGESALAYARCTKSWGYSYAMEASHRSSQRHSHPLRDPWAGRARHLAPRLAGVLVQLAQADAGLGRTL